jgi:hypothetical protein
MTKPTIVTMYFNLKNLPDSSKETRPIEFYTKNGRGTLQLPYPMILFCDSTTKPLLQSLRDELVDPEEVPTVYIDKNFTDYDFYKLCYPTIVENRKRSNYYRNPDSRNTSSYFLLSMFKIIALQIASQRNDFGSYHYFWIDFGFSHVSKKPIYEDAIAMLENPHPKIGMLYIHYRSNQACSDMNESKIHGVCGIAAGVISAEKKYIPRFHAHVLSVFYEMLGSGVGHAEEQVIMYCYDRHPELFTIYFGDYYSLITNYHYVKQDWHIIKWAFIMSAQNAGRHDLAKAAAKKMLEGYEKKQSDLPESEVPNLLSIING